MQEALSGGASALIPGPIQQSRRLAADSPEPLLTTELERFVHRVICDGRFVDEVATDPYRVAEKLDLDLSDEAAEEFKSKPLHEHVGDLCDKRFAALGPLAIVIIVAAIIIIIAITINRYSDRAKATVNDLSEHKDSKL